MGEPSTAELRQFSAPVVTFGLGALEMAGRDAASLAARRALVVSDAGVEAAGWTGRVVDSLRREGIETAVFLDVQPNPRDHEVEAGAERYRSSGCDIIVAVGGGSPMDCAKGIAIRATNDDGILAYEGVDAIENPGPPLICVPTTAGTSADVSRFAIITDTSRGVKIAIISRKVIPDVSLIDPRTTTTMDESLTAATGMDALVHAVEAYVSNAHGPLSDLHALEAIRVVATALPIAVRKPDDLEVRSRMMQASLLAGLAFSSASLGAVHAMAHCLGGLHDLPHGECNALLLEHVCEFNYGSCPERYDRIASALGVDVAGRGPDERRRALVSRLRDLRLSVGIPDRASAKIDAEGIARLARNALRDPCMLTNPRVPEQRDVEVIYERIL
jgi:alcohol dehydrogenase